MRRLLVTGLSLAALLSVSIAAEKKEHPDKAKLEEMTRLQVFLDRANFGPGKIDGRGGEFTSKALELYRTAQGASGETTKPGDESSTSKRKEKKGDKQQIDTSGLDLQSVGDPFTTYTVTKEDVENVGEVPKEPAAKAKLKYLPYQTAAEGIAEKFHADIDFIKELNPQVKMDSLKEGDTLTVPNVEPFEVETVKQLKPGEAFEAGGPVGEKEEDNSSAKSDKDSKESKDKDEEKAPKVAIRVDVQKKMLEVLEGDRLVAAFPVTPGSESIPTPVGEWKVKGVAKMPDFRYDEKMLKEGERSENAHLLPPGPNNPVGIMWIALNKKGIGIHGTDEPDTIGRAASHGCIRLANWDAAKLARMVKSGVPVSIK